MDSIEAVHFCSDSLNGLMPLQRLRLVSAGVAWEGSGVGYLSSGREGAQALLQLFQLLLELLQGHGWLLCASIPAAACQWLITHLLHHTHCHVASLHGSSHSSVTQTYCCSIPDVAPASPLVHVPLPYVQAGCTMPSVLTEATQQHHDCTQQLCSLQGFTSSSSSSPKV